jgi:protein required for attachment to host cells
LVRREVRQNIEQGLDASEALRSAVEIGRAICPAHGGSACARPLRLGSRHHTGSANPDGRRLVETLRGSDGRFLNKLSLEGTMEHLVVVSDPRTLGEMREHFHRDLRGKIIGELARDFSRRPLEDIASLIADA